MPQKEIHAWQLYQPYSYQLGDNQLGDNQLGLQTGKCCFKVLCYLQSEKI